MGKRHPNAGLVNPNADNLNYLKTLRGAIAAYNAAERAGLTGSTKDAIRELGKLFPTFSKRKSADVVRHSIAATAIIAASLGATYDRYSDINVSREEVRIKLRRLREIPDVTTAEVDGVMVGSDFSNKYDELVRNVESVNSGPGRLANAISAAAPDRPDPYDFANKECGCLNANGEQKHAHGDIWHHAPGGNGFPNESIRLHVARRKQPAVESLRTEVHNLVTRVQRDSLASFKAVTDHASAAARAKEEARVADNVRRLGFYAQTSSAASSGAGCQKQPSIRVALSQPTATASSPAQPTATQKHKFGIQKLVAQVALGISADHGKGNRDPDLVRPTGASGACFVYGPKSKAPVKPGTLPSGLRLRLDRHLAGQRAPVHLAGLVMSHSRGTDLVRGARGLRRPRPLARDYSQTSRTMVVDFSGTWARDFLLQAGYDSVPCGRPGCNGHTSPVAMRSVEYQTRIWLAFGLGGEVQGVIARRSTCEGCKAHHQGLNASASKTTWTFCHVNPVTLAKVPQELLSDSFVDPVYMNPDAALWPCRCVSNALEYDVVSKQGFLDMERKLKAVAGLLESTVAQEYEIAVVQWWSGLEKLVGDAVWCTLSDSEQYQLASERAELKYFKRFPAKNAPLVPCVARLDLRAFESMYLEYIERHRHSLLTEYYSRVPTDSISVDTTFEVGSRLGVKGDGLLTITDEKGYLVAAVVAENGKMETTARILSAVANRPGYPKHGRLIINVDDRPVTADGTMSAYEKILTEAAKCMAMVQDYFHVAKNFGTFFSNRHPRSHEWATVKFRDATRVRDAGCESTVDARLLDGLIASTVTHGGVQHVIIAWKTEGIVLQAEHAKLKQAGGNLLELSEINSKLGQLGNLHLDMVTINEWKASGLYHAHFSASRNGKGNVIPYTLRGEDDMDRRFGLCEADFIESMCEQSWTFEQGQRVAADDVVGTVGAIDPSVVAAAGIPIITDAFVKHFLPRHHLRPVDSALVWTAAKHAGMNRGAVAAYCNQFRFHRRKDEYDKGIIASVAEFLKQTCNVRARVSLCRPPEGFAQHAPTSNPMTGNLLMWNGMQLHRQLNHTNNAELNHNRILDIHDSVNYTEELGAALMLAGVNDKNRRNGVARGETTCPHNRAWLEHDRKRRLVANTDLFGPDLPDALKQLELPTEAQMARAAPAASGLDQPGKAVCTRLDAKMGRGAASRSGAVAVPMPAAVQTRPPVAANLAIQELANDTVQTALDLAADLDNMEVLIKEARVALVQGSRTSAVNARTVFAKGLARVAKQHLQRSGQNVDMLNGAELATPALTESEPVPAPAAVEPVSTPARAESEVTPAPAAIEPASLAAPTNQLPPNWIAYATTNENCGDGDVGGTYYHNATTGTTQWAIPMHPPRVAASAEPAHCDDTAMHQPEHATADSSAAAVSGAAPSVPRKRKASSSAPTNAKRLLKPPTFATHNSSSNHPCSCGRNHMPIRPTIGDKVRLRRVAGWRAVVTGSVVAVKEDVATVQLDCDSATALSVRTYSVQHANIVYSVSDGHCTKTCLRTVKKKNKEPATVGDTVAVINLNLKTSVASDVGQLECTGSNDRLGLRGNGQHDLVGWKWHV